MKKLFLYKKFIIPILIFWIIHFSSNVNAAISSVGLLDNVYDNYNSAVTSWGNVIQSEATWLFWCLATIAFVIKFGMLALSKSDLGDFFVEFIKFIMSTGFFLWLLQNGTPMANDIVNSMSQIAATANSNASATGVTMQVTPSSIVDVGFSIFSTIINQTGSESIVDGLVAKLTGLVILVVVALIAVNYLVLKICSLFIIYAGVFFLGFGGSHWTSEMAISYFKTLLSISAQLFSMVLLVGVGQSFVIHQQSLLSQSLSIPELSVMLVSAVILLSLTNKIPPLIGQLAMGGGTGALGGGFGGGAAMAAGATTAAAFSSVGSGIASGAGSGAANIAGVAQAYKGSNDLRAAIAKGQQLEEAGKGGRETGGISGGQSESAGGADSKSSLASSKAIMTAAMKEVITGNAQAGIDKSFSGQIAKNLREELKEINASNEKKEKDNEEKNNQTPTFDNNSIGGSNE